MQLLASIKIDENHTLYEAEHVEGVSPEALQDIAAANEYQRTTKPSRAISPEKEEEKEKEKEVETSRLRKICEIIYKETGIGFCKVRFCESGSEEAHMGKPIINDKGEIEWEIWFNLDDSSVKRYLEILNRGDCTVRELIESDFLNTYLHEYTHTRQYIAKLDIVMSELENLQKHIQIKKMT